MAISSEETAPNRPTGLWRGRTMIIIGVVLLGITLRHAVTGLSPLMPLVREQLSIGIAGPLAPALVRSRGPELIAAQAILLAAAETFGRAFTDSVPVFFVLSVVTLFGMGFGNVVGAPLVKKYFPYRHVPMLTVLVPADAGWRRTPGHDRHATEQCCRLVGVPRLLVRAVPCSSPAVGHPTHPPAPQPDRLDHY